MSDIGKIEANLVGPADATRRRADLLTELNRAFLETGPQAVTDALTTRMSGLVKSFGQKLDQLQELL